MRRTMKELLDDMDPRRLDELKRMQEKSKRQFNVRLNELAVQRLERIASFMKVPKTTVAQVILEQGIMDALYHYELPDPLEEVELSEPVSPSA